MIILLGVSIWFYIDSKKIKPFFKDEAIKMQYEKAQIEKNTLSPGEPTVVKQAAYSEAELKEKEPEMYRILQAISAGSSSKMFATTTLK